MAASPMDPEFSSRLHISVGFLLQVVCRELWAAPQRFSCALAVQDLSARADLNGKAGKIVAWANPSCFNG